MSHKYHYIYKTVNLISGKYYIGKRSTNKLVERYMGSGKLIYRAIKKYGRQNFIKIIICFCDSKEEAFLKEKEIVTKDFCKDPNTYNIKPGGDGGSAKGTNKGIIRTPENKAKISETLSGRPLTHIMTEEICSKISESLMGHSVSEEAYNKMSVSFFKPGHIPWNKGKKIGNEKNTTVGTIWIYDPKSGLRKRIKPKNLNEYIQNGWVKGINWVTCNTIVQSQEAENEIILYKRKRIR